MNRESKRKYVKSKEELQQLAQEQQERECTFQPKINKLPADYEMKQSRGGNRIEQLAKDRSEEYAR